MIRETVTFKSGNRLQVQCAPFAVASALRRAVASELKAVAIDTSSIDFTNLAVSGVPLNTLKDLLMQILSSEKIENAIWDCMEKGPVLLNDAKMNRTMFDGPTGEPLRVDYINSAMEVALANLTPFFAGLDLSWLMPAKTETPASPV